MYEVRAKVTFSAAHNLKGYRGKCENVHGHNWTVEAAVSSAKVDRCGMVIDFAMLKKLLKKVLAELDHSHLNRLAYFKKVNPSSENIAKYVFDKLNKRLTTNDYRLSTVSVWETRDSRAEYRRD
jgi:6-pyruvoyltetrahydropterin/6-carboxytetrahydropterin synthase